MNNTHSDIEDERSLVARVVGGDTHAFAGIIAMTEVLVTQIVTRLVESSEDRKDIAQDIYLKAFRKLPSFKFQSKLSTWIARISYNTCFDYLRKKKLVLIENINDEVEEENLHHQQNMLPVISPNYEPGSKELQFILQSEIARLPPLFNLLITLYHREEMSYMEMMDITGLPEGTVKNYLFRARKELKKRLLEKYKLEDLC